MSTRNSAVQIRGLREFRSALRQLEGKWGPELGKLHRDLAQWLEPQVQGAAAAMGGPQGHFAHTIKGRGTTGAARIEIPARANASFWGAKKRTGWNARNPFSAPQHPRWVGNSGWQVGVTPGGPYAINPTIARNVPEIVDRYGDAIERLARRAFPD